MAHAQSVAPSCRRSRNQKSEPAPQWHEGDSMIWRSIQPLSIPSYNVGTMNRRQALKSIAASCALLSGCGGKYVSNSSSSDGNGPPVGITMPTTQAAFLEDLIQQGCLFFWEQASPTTGQILDRANNYLSGALDSRTMASIASTGFGLTALCIADTYGYLPSVTHAQIVERVQTTLNWHLNNMPEKNGFFYHFSNINTGVPETGSEVSSIDTAILLCGVLAARAYFGKANAQIQSLATQIYERVNWLWMLNGGVTFSMGWLPDSGFLAARYDTYCELMMLYLLAIGSPTYPVASSCWDNFARPVLTYDGYSYISGSADPLFTHQYSHAWFDFRSKRDAYANYFNNKCAQGILSSYLSEVVQRELLGSYILRLLWRLYRMGRTARAGTGRRNRRSLRGCWLAGLRLSRLLFCAARPACQLWQSGLGTIWLCRRLSPFRQLV
jgi:hypothetical protein